MFEIWLVLLKDRIGTYILLQLSFIGWYLLGAIALFIGLLWVIVYVNVSVAEFYEQARIEKRRSRRLFYLACKQFIHQKITFVVG